MGLTRYILACVAVAGCSGAAPDPDTKPVPPTEPTPLPSPLVGEAAIDQPYPRAPLSRLLTMETSRAVTVAVRLDDGTNAQRIRYGVPATSHALPILGLSPDRTYSVDIELIDDRGVSYPLRAETLTTQPLDDSLPEVEVLADDPQRRAPGYTLLSIRNTDHQAGEPLGFYLVVDEAGTPVWAYLADGHAQDIRRRSDGNYFGIESKHNGTAIVEWSVLGEEVARFEPGLDADAGTPVQGVALFHHDAIPFDDGRILALTRAAREVPGYPADYDDPAPTQDIEIADDVVVEFNQAGEVIQSWSISQMLDPWRIGYDSLNVSSDDGTLDWGHANGLVYDADEDIILVSLRHQDAVIKFSRATGELIWILAPPENWTAEHQPYLLQATGGEFAWPYHQHAPMLGPNGEIALFDNGNFRSSPYAAEPPSTDIRDQFSRVVEYVVDETAMTVTQTLDFRGPDDLTMFSDAGGDADYLENGNVLGVFGSLKSQNGLSLPEIGIADRALRVIEFVPGDPMDVVWDLSMFVPSDAADSGWTCYRAERIQSLYPRDLEVTVE